jgi:type II secretion system protein G
MSRPRPDPLDPAPASPAPPPPRRRRTRRGGAPGFTLLDLIVAVGILSVAAAIVIPSLAALEDRARAERTRAELETLAGALEAYHGDHGAWPADIAALEAASYLPGSPAGESWDTDAWFRAYQFAAVGDSAVIVSRGADLAFATPDDLARSVDVTAHRFESTRDEIATIRIALENWETLRGLGSVGDLPPHWDTVFPVDGACRMLATGGLLPEEARFLTDAWGSTYAYAGSPSPTVTSPNAPTVW